ncbi:hypothetical protein FQN49_008732, partial [Arthroderma sp. PD_2]
MISPNARRRSSSSIKQQASGSELVASNSTASRFLGSRPKAWMQNVNTPNAPPFVHRPSRPSITPVDKPGCPPLTQSPSDISPPQAQNDAPRLFRDIGRPTSVSEEPRDVQPNTQYRSPVSPNDVLSPAINIPTTPAPVQQPVHPLPSPNPSHKSDPTATTPRSEPITAEGPPLQPLPAESRPTAPPRPRIEPPQQNVLHSLESPQVTPTTTPRLNPSVATQGNVQSAGDQDEHRDKRPRLMTVQQPVNTQAATATSQQPTSQQPTLQQTTAQPINQASRETPARRMPPYIKPPTDLSPPVLNACMSFLEKAVAAFRPHEIIYVCMLRDACMVQDLQFLALHQLYCLSATSSRPLQGFGPLAKKGIQVTMEALRPMAPLSLNFLKYFSAFPSDFGVLVSQNQKYANEVHTILSWAPCIPGIWPKFFSDVTNRGYPPLIDELIHGLGTHSKVIHFVFFTACSTFLAKNRPPGLHEA